MKAIVYEKYGAPEVLHLKEMPKPTAGPNEVLVRSHATTVSSGDWRVRSLNVPAGFGLMARLALGFFRPRQPILGTEMAGEVEAVGGDVRKFKVGDRVFAFSGLRMGCHVEYKTFSEDGPLALKPANLSYEEAAAIWFGGDDRPAFPAQGKHPAGGQGADQRRLGRGGHGGGPAVPILRRPT